jgi:hypothetical protein
MSSTDPVSHQDLVVCTCGEQEYTARDTIEAAIFRGELDATWKRFLARVAAEKQAEEQDLDPDDAAISAAAEAFRYDHDLITAEETEAWLESRGLTLDDFSDYFCRQYYASVLQDIAADEVEYISASSALRELFVAELILSGELERMMSGLMWRLAARCAETDRSPDLIALDERKFFERNRIKRAQLANWLERLGRDLKWFNEMLELEAAYRRCCEKVLVPRARQRELVTLRLLLTRFETEFIELESRDAAREALFCVREDGMSMEEVAAEGRYPYEQANFIFEELPTDSQRALLGVSAGEVLEPVPRGDGFELWRLIKKVEPEADDPGVKVRIDQRLLERHFSELVSKYIQRTLGGAISVE